MSYKLNRFSLVISVICALLFIGGAISLVFVKDNAAQSRIAFQMFETALMMFLILVPRTMKKVAHIKIPKLMDIMFVTFCFCTLILGDVVDFYSRFEWWDALQHGISGVLLGVLGYIIINTFNSVNGNTIRYTPAFVSIWVVCFALATGALWEIMEYITDGLFGLNSQQFLTTGGTFDASEPLVGREALKDTMEDLILDFMGSTTIAIIGFFEMRKQKKGIADLYLEIDDKDE